MQDLKDKVKKKITTHLELNENKNSTCQNLQDRTKPVLKEKYTAFNLMRKEGSFQIQS